MAVRIIVKNREKLLEDEEGDKRSLLLDLVELAISVSDPRDAIRKSVKLNDECLTVFSERIPLRNVENIYVVGAGKASGAMAEALEEILGELIVDGAVCIQKGTSNMFSTRFIRLFEAAHPVPSEENIRGAEAVVGLLEEAGKDDLVICLISGGGSAMLTLPADGVELQDIQEVTAALL
ncbi:MAG: DUF4147 domain-containing protein, partial [Candidatus Jordarchaeales archaeon]